MNQQSSSQDPVYEPDNFRAKKRAEVVGLSPDNLNLTDLPKHSDQDKIDKVDINKPIKDGKS
jgi:hypothetical protein